jgi:hypothetical protein
VAHGQGRPLANAIKEPHPGEIPSVPSPSKRTWYGKGRREENQKIRGESRVPTPQGPAPL